MERKLRLVDSLSLFQIISSSSSFRYANPGDVVVGHFAYAGKRSAFVFLCLFHFRHNWSSVVGRYFEAALRLAIA